MKKNLLLVLFLSLTLINSMAYACGFASGYDHGPRPLSRPPAILSADVLPAISLKLKGAGHSKTTNRDSSAKAYIYDGDRVPMAIGAGSPPTISYATPNYYSLNTPIAQLAPTSSGVSSINYPSTPNTLLATGSTGVALSSPWGIGADASGNIYVVNRVGSTGTVCKYTSATATPTNFITGLNNPSGIAFDPSSGVAYVCQTGGKVYKYPSTGGSTATSTLYSGSGSSSVTGVTVDASSNVYIADYGLKAVYKYNSTGTLQLTISSSSTLIDPSNVQVDAAGNIYILDAGSATTNASVQKYSSTGTYISTIVAPVAISTTANPAYGFCMDKSGNFWVGNNGSNTINMYSQNGTNLYTISASVVTNPRGVYVDGTGTVYTTNYTTNAFYQFIPTGGYFVASGGALPAGLSLLSTNGAISGTPTVAGSGTYTVIAYNSSGSATSNSFVLNCSTTAVTISYTPAAFYFPTSAAIPAISAAVTGSPTSYAISPALPTGLTFNTGTGGITGTPSASSPATTYTITTSGGANTSSTTIGVVVSSAPTISYTTPNYYAVGSTITPLTPTSASVASAGYSSAITLPGPLPSSPYGMGIDGSGNIYVTNNTGNNVTEYSSSGTYTGVFIASVTSPSAIVFDASGNAYVGTKTGSVYKYNSSGTLLGTVTSTPASVYGLGIDASNNLYIADFTNAAVYKYTNATPGTLSLTIPSSANLTDPVGVEVDAAGNLYIDDSGGMRIVKYSSTGTFITNIASSGQGSPAYGFYMDKSGDIYIGDSGNNDVRQYSQTGVLLYTFSTSTLTSPRGIVVDNAGDVYVSVYTKDLLYKYTPLGDFYISSGGLLPAGLTFNGITGAISGTPTITASGTYTVTGYKSSGIPGTSNSFVINCGTSTVTISYTPSTYYMGTGTAISPITPVVTGSPTSYAISVALPTGLSFSTTTGAITGTPTAASPVTTYTITATGTTNSNTATITITVAASPTISYSTPNNYPIANAITALTPTSVSVGAAGYSSPIAFTGPSANAPYGMGLDAGGNIYVANTVGNNVTEYTSAGAYIGVFIASVTSPSAIVFDASGNIYVGTKTGSVFKYNSSGTLLGTVTSTPASVYGMAIDASGNLYLADYTNMAVYEYSNGTPGALNLTIPVSTNLVDPAGVQVDAAGNIYVDDIGATTSRVQKFSSAGVFISTLVSGLGVPTYGFYMDKSGNIYVGDSGNSQVGVYTQGGTLIYDITAGTLSSPRGVVVDNYGDVYVSVYTKNVLSKYTPLGDYFLTSGGTLPPGLTFNSASGSISGTPTTATSGTYTVTAYTSTGIPGTSNSFVINCYTSYDWIGATSSFSTATNWESQVVPTSTSAVYIGVNFPFSVTPVVAANTSIASIGLGNKGGSAAGISVNTGATLTLSGDITKQSDPTATTYYTSLISGTGTISAVNLNVVSNTTGMAAYTDGISSSATSLLLSGNVNLTSGFSTYAENASFSVTGGITTVTGLLNTTNAAGSDVSTIWVTNGTLQLVNAAALSSLSANGTNVISFVNTGATVEYSGAAQSVYNDAAITGLPGGVSYQNIKFSGTGVKTVSTGNLNVAGDFTNTMANNSTNYVTLSTPTVNFNGTTQSLAGGAGSGSVLGTVTFSGLGTKTMVSGAFSVISTGTLTMSGTNSATVLNAGGFLTLNSDVNGCAMIPAINGPSISGNVNVQRYISGGNSYDRGYRQLSSPVYAATVGSNNVYSVNYLINNCYVKGTTGTSGGFDAAGNDNIYLYRENTPPSNISFTSGNFNGINTLGTAPNYTYLMDGISGSFNIPVGDGYMFFYRGDRKNATIATETTLTYVPTSDTLSTSGIINQGTVTVADWYTPTSANLGWTTTTANSAIRGFNLVGNPYPSSINWDNFSATNSSSPIYGPNLSGSIYVFSISSQNYATYLPGTGGTHGATGIIPSGQGFFVQATGTGAALTFQESAKVSTQVTGSSLLLARRPSNFKSNSAAGLPGIDYHFRLSLSADSINTDDIFVKFNSAASATYVATEDAEYKKGFGTVSLSSFSVDNVQLAINQLPFPANSYIMPLNVAVTGTGVYTLNMYDIINIPEAYDIWLMDYHNKDSLDIKNNFTYAFNASQADTTSFGANRFALVIRQNPAYAYRLLSFAGAKAQTGVQLTWTTANEGDYTSFVVQRSVDNGKTFSAIGAINSSGVENYGLLDASPVIGTDTYRLEQIGITGDTTYSGNIAVVYPNPVITINGGNNGITVYPNPATSTVYIAVLQTTAGQTNQNPPAYVFTVTNSVGQVIATENTTQQVWTDNVTNLLPGAYFINVVNNKDKSIVGSAKFVKL